MRSLEKDVGWDKCQPGGCGLINGNNGTYCCRIRLEAEMMTNRISAPYPVLAAKATKDNDGGGGVGKIYESVLRE